MMHRCLPALSQECLALLFGAEGQDVEKCRRGFGFSRCCGRWLWLTACAHLSLAAAAAIVVAVARCGGRRSNLTLAALTCQMLAVCPPR